VAEQTLDIQALKAVVAKSGRPHRSARGGGVAADARHESATGLSNDWPEHGDVAVSATHQRDERRRAGATPGARGRARSLRLSAAAHPARAGGPHRESQTGAPDLSSGRSAGASAAAQATHTSRARACCRRRASGSSVGRWTSRWTPWPMDAAFGR
jgi:hypothetical protein